jgi:hypothetical protein
MDNNPGIFQQQLNRVQIHKSTSSICKNHLTFSASNEMRQQSSTYINPSTGARPVSGVARVCTCRSSLRPAYAHGQCIQKPAYTF